MRRQTLSSRRLVPTHCGCRLHKLSGACRAQNLPAGFTDMDTSILAGPKLLLSPAERARLDERPDHLFYATPRMMQHESPAFLAATTELLGAVLPPSGRLLDLCASWDSHLPPLTDPEQGGSSSSSSGSSGSSSSHLAPEQEPEASATSSGTTSSGWRWEVVGVGMNQTELAANKALNSWLVQDLNVAPHLEQLEDATFAGCLLVNGVQYLTQLEVVMGEVHRLLQPGGVLVVVFGEACWAEKALAGWLSRDMAGRARLLSRVLHSCGFVDVVIHHPGAAGGTNSPGTTTPTTSTSSSSDAPRANADSEGAAAPVMCAVVGRKPAGQTAAAAAAGGGVGWGAVGGGGGGGGGLRPGMEPAAAAAAMMLRYPYLADLAQHVEGAGAAGAPSSSGSSSGSSDDSTAVLTSSSDGDWGTEGDRGLGAQGGTQVTQQQQEEGGQGDQEVTAAAAAAAAAAGDLVISSRSSQQLQPGPADTMASPVLPAGQPPRAVLERWQGAYLALCGDAADLGIPASALPRLPPDATAQQLQEATEHLQNMIASFLSSGL